MFLGCGGGRGWCPREVGGEEKLFLTSLPLYKNSPAKNRGVVSIPKEFRLSPEKKPEQTLESRFGPDGGAESHYHTRFQ